MTQGTLQWQADVSLYVAGKSPRTRHASATGSLRAATDRGSLSVAYVTLLRVCGPLSDHAAGKALGRLHTSINSTRHGLGDRVVDSGLYETTAFGTRRTRWMAAR